MKTYLNKYCVYYHKHGDRVFYVGAGTSERPFNRNSRTAFWWKFIKKLNNEYEVEIVRWFNTRSQALKFEAQEIARLQPIMNGEMRNYIRGMSLEKFLKFKEYVIEEQAITL